MKRTTVPKPASDAEAAQLSLPELAAAYGLARMGTRPPLGRYLIDTVRRSDFIATMAAYRLRAMVAENRLGLVWYVIRPLLDAAIYGFIFGVVQGSSRPPDFVSYVLVGTIMFRFFQTSFADGAGCIVGSRALIQSLAFPRLTLVLSFLFQNFLAFIPPVALLPIILSALGHDANRTWFMMFPLIALFSVFCTGISLIAARITVHVRDFGQLVPVISRILYFSSGVLFSVDTIFSAHPLVMRLYDFHPLYVMIRISRGILMGVPYPDYYWEYFAIWSFAIAAVGLIFFWFAEERYGRE
ncbi:MAG: ABC transporter permease [Propionibacteriaceae bacterium]|nr:ABC transporter permease [Propionibacteriaceae bacterium]